MTHTQTKPDAERIVYRIKTALKGESIGLETARLAWQYAEAVEIANAQLLASAKHLPDSTIEAYLSSEFSPRLLDTVDILEFAEKEKWTERCITFSWRKPAVLNLEASQKLRNAFADKEEPKEWLYTEYRERARARNNEAAYTIIKLLSEKYPDDPNIREEFKRQHERMGEQAAKDIQAAREELISADSIPAVLAKYRSFGYEFTIKKGPLHDTLDAENAAKIKQVSRDAQAVIEAGKSIEANGDWKTVEELYLKCEYDLAQGGTRAKIGPTLREEYNKAGSDIAHARGVYETDILIRQAIKQLHLAIAGQSEKTNGKALTPREAVSRIKSLESQGKRMGHRFTAALQSEISAAYRKAKRNLIPKIALVAGAAFAVIFGLYYYLNTQSENAAREATLAQALSELNEAYANESAIDSAKALSNWKTQIEASEADAPLAQKANEVQAWIESQQKLEIEYRRIANSLEAIKSSGIESEEASNTLSLISQSEETRKNLASELGAKEDDRIANFLAWRDIALKQQARLVTSSYDRLIKTAIDRVEQARAALSIQSFTTQSKAASDALFQANRILIERKPDLGTRDPQKEIAKVTADLEELQSKWSALNSVQRKLENETTLDGYFSQLERIQSFDITPRDEKSAIARVLKQQDGFSDLKRDRVLPDDPKAKEAFQGSGPYASANAIPSPEEQAYLERLANDPSFGSIYKSRVQYFEGELAAKSEYYVFLAKEIELSQTPVKSGTSFAFQVQGFDEFGEKESSTREMNFLTRTDGTAWGFRYYPSELSPESLYYEEELRVLFLQVLAGAPRLSLIGQVDDLNKNRSLSPAFRAYWQEQIFELLEMNPWKWGYALAPTLQTQNETLKRIGRGGIAKQQWLSSVEQTAPSIEFIEYFREVYRLDVLKETVALATLYEKALDGKFELVGVANAKGSPKISDPKALKETKWAVHAQTGLIQALGSELELAPYSPILVYRFDGQDGDRLFKNVELQTGIDLRDSKFKKQLPALLQ